MKTIILENGKKVKISEESYTNFVTAIKEKNVNNDSSLVETYKYVCDLKETNKILTTIKKSKQVYVNQVFSDNSVFGNECVFIKCEFGSSCKFGSYCEFGLGCKFGSYCEFGSSCEFGSICEFGEYCKDLKK
jgi:hypothetical protein